METSQTSFDDDGDFFTALFNGLTLSLALWGVLIRLIQWAF